MITWIPHIPGFVQADPSDYEPKHFTNFEKLKNFLLEKNSGFLNDNWKLVYEVIEHLYNRSDNPAICIMVVNEERDCWWVRGHITNYDKNERQCLEKDSLFHKFIKYVKKMEIEETK